MLRNQIFADYLKAFKEKNTYVKNVLSVLKSDIMSKEKTLKIEVLDDKTITNMLNKTLKSIKESLVHQPNDEELLVQLTTIENYLPKMLSESETIELVNKLIDSGVDCIGGLMKVISKENVDKKLVAKIAKEKLS